MVLVAGVSALLLAGFSPIMANPFAVSADDVVLLCVFGVAFAAAVILWTEGTRRITALSSSIVLTCEAPLRDLAGVVDPRGHTAHGKPHWWHNRLGRSLYACIDGTACQEWAKLLEGNN